MEIKILKEQLPVVAINYEEIKENLVSSLKKYENFVVTEDNYKGCKQIRKELTALKNNIDKYRKDKKKQLSEPIKAFEGQCKELMELVEDVELPIKNATDTYDDEVKQQKLNFASNYIEEKIKTEGILPDFAKEVIVKDAFGNLSISKAKIKADINEQVAGALEKQNKFLELLEVIADAIRKENETLINKLSVVAYKDKLLMASDSYEVITAVKDDAAKIRSFEEEARKAVINEKSVEEPTIEEPTIEEPIAEEEQFCYAMIRITGSKSKVEEAINVISDKKVQVEVLSRVEL